jgi:hypothetical protein
VRLERTAGLTRRQRSGATASAVSPSIQASSQKRIESPLPKTILTEALKSARESCPRSSR